MRIGMVVHGFRALTPTWTTVHLAHAAHAMGHEVWFMESKDLGIRDGLLTARASKTTDKVVDQLRHGARSRKLIAVRDLDILLLRCAPMTSSLFAWASIAHQQGVAVVNHPGGISAVSHKGWLAAQRDLPAPTTLVTRSPAEAALFFAEIRGPAIVKSATGSGGSSVQRIPKGMTSRLENLVRRMARMGQDIVIQPWVDAQDERRLVWCDGRILGGYARRPAPGEFRHNLKQGASSRATEITTKDRELGERLSTYLLPLGIRFAGLDVLGTRLLEVNVANPGGSFHADRLSGTDTANQVIAALTA